MNFGKKPKDLNQVTPGQELPQIKGDEPTTNNDKYFDPFAKKDNQKMNNNEPKEMEEVLSFILIFTFSD